MTNLNKLKIYEKYIDTTLDEIRNEQLSYLIKFVNKIKQTSEYYRKILKGFPPISTYEDFQKLPLLEANTLRERPIDELRGASWRDIALVTRSSGTTGKSKLILWTKVGIKQERKWGKLGYLKIFQIQPQDRIAIMAPFELTPVYSNVLILQDIGAFVIPIGRLRTDVDIDNAIERIKLLRATHLLATPTRLLTITQRIEHLGMNIKKDFCIKKIITTGQILTNNMRRSLVNKWKCEVTQIAGSNEFNFLGFECSQQNGLHILPHPNYFEILDIDTLKPITDNDAVGEIVITNYTNFGTPLLRYRIGDLGSINYNMCDCGLPYPRLSIRGRTVGSIIIGGTKLYAYEIEEILNHFNCLSNNYQVVIHSDNSTDIVQLIIETSDIQAANKIRDKLTKKLSCASSTIYDKILSKKVLIYIHFQKPLTLERSEGDKIKNQYLDKRILPYT